jgi:hypothetical protein
MKTPQLSRKEKNELIAKIFVISFISIFGIGFLCLIRVSFISPSMNYNEVCKLEYGKNWAYEYSEIFGKTCIFADYISLKVINRTQLVLSNEEITMKYCNPPNFFDFRIWNNGCESLK